MIVENKKKSVYIYRDNINTLHKDTLTTLTINHYFEKIFEFQRWAPTNFSSCSKKYILQLISLQEAITEKVPLIEQNHRLKMFTVKTWHISFTQKIILKDFSVKSKLENLVNTAIV